MINIDDRGIKYEIKWKGNTSEEILSTNNTVTFYMVCKNALYVTSNYDFFSVLFYLFYFFKIKLYLNILNFETI